jgi:hypothetical protein
VLWTGPLLEVATPVQTVDAEARDRRARRNELGTVNDGVLAMLILIIAVLVAAAVSDAFADVRAWKLATIIGAAHIVSRGLAEGGTDHTPFLGRRRTPPLNPP